MNLSRTSAATALNAMNALFNDGTLTFYAGAIPRGPNFPIRAGQTALATFRFAKRAFGPPVATSLQETATASFATGTVTPTASGTASFARAVAHSYGTVLADYTVGEVWAPSTPVTVGQYVVSGGNTYVCMMAGTTGRSGGPTGTGTNIADGTVAWTWNNTGSTDILLPTTALSNEVPITVRHLTVSMPTAG